MFWVVERIWTFKGEMSLRFVVEYTSHSHPRVQTKLLK